MKQASSDQTDASELDKLVLHNECGLSVVRVAHSLIACDVPNEVKRAVTRTSCDSFQWGFATVHPIFKHMHKYDRTLILL